MINCCVCNKEIFSIFKVKYCKECRDINKNIISKIGSMQSKNNKLNIKEIIGVKELISIYDKKKCFYCGCDVNKGKNANIDRKIPSLGYKFDNCLLSCRQCNNFKSSRFTQEETKLLIDTLKIARNKDKSPW